MVCYHRAIRLRLSVAAERTITMGRGKEKKLDSTSVAFSPLETNSSTQTAYHQAAYPDQAVTKRCPAPASNQSRTRSRWDRPTRLGQLLNDTEGKKKTLIDKGNRLTTQLPSDRGRAGQANDPPSLLCPTVGARGLKISQGVYVHVLNERIEEEIEEEAGRGPSSPETNSMAGRVRVCNAKARHFLIELGRGRGQEHLSECRSKTNASIPLQTSDTIPIPESTKWRRASRNEEITIQMPTLNNLRDKTGRWARVRDDSGGLPGGIVKFCKSPEFHKRSAWIFCPRSTRHLGHPSHLMSPQLG